MPLVAAAVLPHAPVLVPAIAAGHAAFTKATQEAMVEAGKHFRATQVETCIVLTPHGPSVDERMTIITSETIKPDLRTFGDVSAYPSWKGNISFTQQLRALADLEHVPSSLATTDVLDYGVAVPLLAADVDQKTAIVPIAIDHLSREMIVRIGHVLNEAIHQSPDRIAVIASADLEERTTADHDPKRPTAWERSIATAVRNGDPEELPADDGRSCGFSPIAVLLSLLSPTPATGTILHFDAPFRVGYMVADLDLKR